MGHERLGVLPKTHRWRDLVQQIGGFPSGGVSAQSLAQRTLSLVQSRYEKMGRDAGVQAAFTFLVTLATSIQSQEQQAKLRGLGVDLASNPNPLSLTTALKRCVSQNRQSAEHSQMAQAAAADAIAEWHNSHQTGQQRMFAAGPKALEIWEKAGTGTGFCELARSFFAHLTNRYLNYFLEREASAAIGDVGKREQLRRAIANHVTEVSNHAFETAIITRSFAAGWFNAHARTGKAEARTAQDFLTHAFGKMREELLREGNR